MMDPVGQAERAIVKAGEGWEAKQKELLEEFRELGIWVSNPRKTGRDEISLPQPSTVLKVVELAKKIAKGKQRMDLINELVSEGMSIRSANGYYDAAVRFLTPTDPEEFKKGLVAKNLARFEDIYQKAYEANQWKTCKDILDSMNKMYGLAGGNSVSIAENAEGERIIQIKFD